MEPPAEFLRVSSVTTEPHGPVDPGDLWGIQYVTGRNGFLCSSVLVYFASALYGSATKQVHKLHDGFDVHSLIRDLKFYILEEVDERECFCEKRSAPLD